MSSPTIKPVGDGAELLSLVEQQMRKHNLRLRPGQTIASTVEEMQKEGLSLKVEHGTLTGDVSGQTANIPGCFESFYSKHDAAFFPRDVTSGIRSRDQMDFKGKSDFISKHGLAAFENLPRTAEQAGPTELDPATITAAQYAKLPLKTKSDCVTAWGSATVAQIMVRKK